jgi:hypothetical protein
MARRSPVLAALAGAAGFLISFLAVWASVRYAFRDYEFCFSLFGSGCEDVRTDVDPLPLYTLLPLGVVVGAALPSLVLGVRPGRALAMGCLGYALALIAALAVGLVFASAGVLGLLAFVSVLVMASAALSIRLAVRTLPDLHDEGLGGFVGLVFVLALVVFFVAVLARTTVWPYAIVGMFVWAAFAAKTANDLPSESDIEPATRKPVDAALYGGALLAVLVLSSWVGLVPDSADRRIVVVSISGPLRGTIAPEGMTMLNLPATSPDGSLDLKGISVWRDNRTAEACHHAELWIDGAVTAELTIEDPSRARLRYVVYRVRDNGERYRTSDTVFHINEPVGAAVRLDAARDATPDRVRLQVDHDGDGIWDGEIGPVLAVAEDGGHAAERQWC